VLLDGELVNSCLVPVVQAAGARVVTIEGVQQGDRLHPVQEAFLAHGGAQCGICTPGMVMAAVHLLGHNPAPTAEQVREGLAGNLCRCTGYTKILEAVVAAGEKMSQATAGPTSSAPGARQAPSSRGAQRRSDLDVEIATGPAGPRDDTSPAGPRDDTSPAGPRDDTSPAGPRDDA
jgi:xanthine dehydrogenase iron-sulfur cluster and FAD-binding subunit A